MNSIKDVLAIRNKLKSKKPTFLRQDAHKIKRLKNKWRQPRGRHSKMRFKLRSYRRQPSIGFSSPQSVRGLTPSGQKVILVSTLAQLEMITDPITISSQVGTKKKLEIVKKAKAKNISVLNVKDIDGFIAAAEDAFKQRKEAKKKKITAKEKKKLEVEKKAEEKKKEEEARTREEKIEEQTKKEKEEKKKVLEGKKQ